MTSTVHDVALVFEGGGMRNSYSAGAIGVMLEQGLFFDDVYGLSAGATNAIDYV
ncbi:MAG: patatin-like phospholipase family protein, partial [Eggerthella lenta]